MHRSPAPRSPAVRRRMTRGILTNVGIALLALAAATHASVGDVTGRTVGAPLQLARAARASRSSHWSDTSSDSNAEGDKPLWSSKAKPVGSRGKAAAGGYNPQRVQRFWSHYHRTRPGPKEKPLERQPRDK